MSQSRDGRKSVPHVVSVSGNMDRGVMAFLSNSLQQLIREDGKKRQQQRKVMLLHISSDACSYLFFFFCHYLTSYLLFQVLKLHPVLAPVKVALDIGKGATVELRQVSVHSVIPSTHKGKSNGLNMSCRSVRAFCRSSLKLRSLHGLDILKLCQHHWSI